jgi:hypothetical protein
MRPRIFRSMWSPGKWVWVCRDHRGHGAGITPAGSYRALLDKLFVVGRMTISEYQLRSSQMADKAST